MVRIMGFGVFGLVDPYQRDGLAMALMVTWPGMATAMELALTVPCGHVNMLFCPSDGIYRKLTIV